MLSEKEYLEYQGTMELQEKWIDAFYTENPEKDGWDAMKKIPLKLIPIINEDAVLSFTYWVEVKKQNPKANRDSEDDELVDLYISMQENCIFEPDDANQWITRGKWHIWSNTEWTMIMRSETENTQEIFHSAMALWLLWD